MTKIAARNIVLRYADRTILHDVAFEADAGAITVIAGPNGSGKSSLIKALSGEVAISGKVTINDDDIRQLRPWQLATRRAVLAQETSVAFPFSVAEVVRLGVTAGLPRRADADDMVETALARVGLAGFGPRPIQTLSGGERQRVHLARVLCQIWEPVDADGPRWLIMDEPVASLDIRHQIALMDLAEDYALAGGGVIAVMHDLNLSAMYADRIVLMKEGRVAASGTPEAVLTAPLLAEVFACPLRPGAAPPGGLFVLPQSARSPASRALAAE